jgi:hypothetical protein
VHELTGDCMCCAPPLVNKFETVCLSTG